MNQKVDIVGVPMDLGQARRGVDMGPSAVRYAGLQARLERIGFTVQDHGNINVPGPEQPSAEGSARRLRAVTAACEQVFTVGRTCLQADNVALFLGGDHSMSIGTVSAAADRAREDGGPLGLIWVDAHGDFNTPQTSPTGNIHGMPVAVLLGDGPEGLVDLGYPGAKLKPSQVVQIGIRNLDGPERQRLKKSGIHVFTMRDIDEHGMALVARQALDRLRHVERLHISLDMDSLDPSVAAGVGTPVPGGLSYREAHLLMEILSDSGKVFSADVVEINPILDDRNHTADLAVELVASLLGQRIL